MAIDQNQTPSTYAAPSSAIENELPAYRAISALAVVSLLCGLLAILSFAHWFFLVFAAAAIGLGLLAERKIRRDPEIWTGRGMAQAGVALGLMFGLSAVTTTLVQEFLRKQAATTFGKQYTSVLKNGTVEDAIYYTVLPASREGKKPAELYKELKEHSDPRAIETQGAAVEKIKKRLSAGSGEDIHFVKLEDHGLDGLNIYATALLELHGPGSTEFPEKQQFAVLVLKGVNSGKKTEWYVDSAKFPYVPSTYVHQEKAADDGHGHSH